MRNTCPSSNGGNLAVGGKHLSCTRAFLLSCSTVCLYTRCLAFVIASHSSETGRRFRAEQAVLIYFVSFLVEILARVERTFSTPFSREFFRNSFFTSRFESIDALEKKFHQVIFYSRTFVYQRKKFENFYFFESFARKIIDRISLILRILNVYMGNKIVRILVYIIENFVVSYIESSNKI